MADTYDLIPYTEHAYAASSPDNLAVIARVVGFHGGPFLEAAGARVLELGCGRGGNLLPLAAAWPELTCVGVDRSTAQIREARRVAEGAALPNVTFLANDFAAASVAPGSFDFVIVHGVYSWIPVAARRALLAHVRDSLAPDGVAYVSFNTLPGWYRHLAARDWMRFAARSSFAEGPRDALRWLARVVSTEHRGYRESLDVVHQRLLATDAAYLTHEYLAEEHHPVLVAGFLAEANLAGLTYAGDALPSEVTLELAPEAVQARARELDLEGALQLADFTRDTAFRRAILVRSDTAEARRFRAPDRLDARALTELRFASRLTGYGSSSSGLASFEASGMTVQVSGLARGALAALAEAAPRSITCAELARAVGATPEAVAEEIYDLWLAAPGLDVHAREPDFTVAVSARPRANGVARWHAAVGGPVTNAWHQEVELREPFLRDLLGRLDGRATVGELADGVALQAQGRVSGEEARAVVEASLSLLAKSALLVG